MGKRWHGIQKLRWLHRCLSLEHQLFQNVAPVYFPSLGAHMMWEGVHTRVMWILLGGVEVAVATLIQVLVLGCMQLLHLLLKAVWLWVEAQQLKDHHTVHGRK